MYEQILPNRSVDDRELVRRAINSVIKPATTRNRNSQVRWAATMNLFSVGSTVAREICAELGYNPDEEVKR